MCVCVYAMRGVSVVRMIVLNIRTIAAVLPRAVSTE